MKKDSGAFLSSLAVASSGLGLFVLLILSCQKESPTLTPSSPSTSASLSFVEEFDTVANLGSKGWQIINKSEPFGSYAWRQGRYELGGKYGNEVFGFAAYSAVYNPNEFISADLNACKNLGTISCWLITRILTVKNGDVLSFYTRTHGDYPDRLEVRGNFTTSQIELGNSSESTGDFSTLLLTINPDLTPQGYPTSWTPYSIVFSGLSGVVQARIGFRYYVTRGGPGGDNSDMIGLDKLEFISK
jgi:hypothetical protein